MLLIPLSPRAGGETPTGLPHTYGMAKELPVPSPPSPILTQLQQGGLQHTPAPWLGESPPRRVDLEIRDSLRVLCRGGGRQGRGAPQQ